MLSRPALFFKLAPPRMLSRPELRIYALLAGAVLLAYLPVARAGFVWDDAAHVTAPALRSLSGLGRIWIEPGATQQYYPLLHSAFWLEHHLWGDAPLGYHLANLLFHLVAAGLFFGALKRLAIPGAWIAALLFALHPVQAESVAWISEQKNTLSTCFYLGAALAYGRFELRRRPVDYGWALLLFACALLTKTVTATLPAALLVITWWRRGTLSPRRDILPLVPWLAFGLVAGISTAWIERTQIGAEGITFELAVAQRALLAGRAAWFYAATLLWPAHLAFFYPRWTLSPAEFVQWLPLAGIVLASASAFLVRHRTRAPLATVLFFVGSLFPALGFFNVYPFQYSFVADHFQYLASLGVFAVTGAVLANGRVFSPRLGLLFTAATIVPLGVLTFRQSETYRDAPTLFRATLARNPSSWIAWNNLGKELLAAPSRHAEAMACFERALALRPDYFEAHNNLGLALSQRGRFGDAIPHLQEAARLQPRSYQVHNNLGIALASSGRAAEALAAFQTAAELNPRLPNIQENWAKAFLLLGRKSEAEMHFEAARRLRASVP